MSNFEPRSFQVTGLSAMNRANEEYKKWLLVMPCGAGKTKTFLFWLSLKPASDPIFPIWIAVHEGELVAQWLEALGELFEFGDYCGISAKAPIAKADRKHLGLRRGARIVVCMEGRIARSISEADRFELSPRSVCVDEAHLLVYRAGVRVARRWMQRTNHDSKYIGLTGSACNHEKNLIQVADVWPRECWVTPVSNAELTAAGYWAPQDYMEIPEPYLGKAEKLFKGLFDRGETFEEDCKGNLSTSASNVMKALMPDMLEVLGTIERRASESYFIFCADTTHAQRMSEELTSLWGYPVPVVTGETNPDVRAKVLRGLRDGTVAAVCLVGCWLCGTDIKNCKTVIFATYKGSYPEFIQMATRGVRPGILDCVGLPLRVYDLAGNVGKHGLIEDAKFGPEDDLHMINAGKFRHAAALMCQNPECLAVHKTFPKPYLLNQEGILVKSSPSSGLWGDLEPIHEGTPIACPECGTQMTADLSQVNAFLEWKWGGSDSESMPSSSGLALGPQYSTPVTYGLLADMGWYSKALKKKADQEEAQKAKDNSEQWVLKCDRWRVLYSQAKQRGEISKALGPSFTENFRLCSDAKIREEMTRDYPSLMKGLMLSIGQAFDRGADPLSVYTLVSMYPKITEVAYGENPSGESAVASEASKLPHGYTPKRTQPVKVHETLLLFGFTKGVRWLVKGAENLEIALDLISAWTFSYMEVYEEKSRVAQSMGDFSTSTNAKNSSRLIAGMLEILNTIKQDPYAF